MTASALKLNLETATCDELAAILRLQCAITDAEADGFPHLAQSFRTMLAQQVGGRVQRHPAILAVSAH
jgi:hypothetical protein